MQNARFSVQVDKLCVTAEVGGREVSHVIVHDNPVGKKQDREQLTCNLMWECKLCMQLAKMNWREVKNWMTPSWNLSASVLYLSAGIHVYYHLRFPPYICSTAVVTLRSHTALPQSIEHWWTSGQAKHFFKYVLYCMYTMSSLSQVSLWSWRLRQII